MLVHDKAVYDAALQESLDRQAALDIKIMDVVQDVEAGRPLHTFNHPSNHVMWTMAHRVLSFLDLPLSNAATRPEREILDEIRAPVPDGLLAVQGASWRAPHFVVRGEALPDDRLVASFYESYAELDDFKGLMEFNERRFGPQSRFADLGWQLPKPTGSA